MTRGSAPTRRFFGGQQAASLGPASRVRRHVACVRRMKILAERRSPRQRQRQRSEQRHADRNGQARKNIPVTPVIAISGKKTTIGVIVEPTSGTRNLAAARCGLPLGGPVRHRGAATIFSTTTMASSITRPTAAASPPSVIRLKLSPITFSTMNVTSTVAGITSPATSEAAPVAQEQHQDDARPESARSGSRRARS